MKQFMRLTRTFAVNAMIFSLLQTSFVFNAQAAGEGSTAQDIQAIAQVTLGAYSQYLGMKQQTIMSQIQAQKNTQMMQTLSPSCRKPDGTSCYTVAGKFFPECPLPASMTSMPQNVCSSATPDPAQIASMITYESIAKGWINYFDQMMNEASNMATPFGLKCLQDKQKALDSQLTEMQNNLTRLQDQLNKDKETFRANNKKLLEELAATNDELLGAGGSGKNNLALKTKDFSKYFSPSCQSIIGADGMREGPAVGLLGIMQALSPVNKRAADHNANRTLIEAEVRNDIEKIQKTIREGGLQDYFDGKITETSKFQSLIAATQKQSAEFKIAKDRIAKELKELNYDIPTMDKNFAIDFDEFLAGSKEFFKKQYVNECVTGADKSGIAISVDQILKSLEQKSTGNQGAALERYRTSLRNILESDSFIGDNINKIKSLENPGGQYQDITVTYRNSKGQKVTETPYQLYMKTIAKCEQRYKQDDQFTASGSKGVSQKKKVDRGQALLRELKNLHDTYASDLGTKVLEKVLTCNGEQKKSGEGCSSKDAFDYSTPTFCLSQANECANEVNGCYAEADKHVQTRKAKMETLAKTFNANTQALVVRANQLYDKQKLAVMDMIKVVQARFPGTNFAIPEGMFISMPEMKKDSFGVELANDGNMAFMDELPKKIDLLKNVFKNQQAKVNEEIDTYIDKQTQAMSREKERWQQLAGECKNMIDTSSREIAKMNNENLKKQAETDNKVKKFCRKYSNLGNHPVGGCSDAKKLSSEIDDIAFRLNPNVDANLSEFNGTCNAYNNESNESDGSSPCDVKNPTRAQELACDKEIARRSSADSDSSTPSGKKSSKKGKVDINQLCKNGDGHNSDSEFVEKVLGKLPKSEREKFSSSDKKDDLVKAFKSGNLDDVQGYEDLEDDGVFSDLASLIGPLKENGDSICGKLLEIQNQKPPVIMSQKEKDEAYDKAKKDFEDFEKENPKRDDAARKNDQQELSRLERSQPDAKEAIEKKKFLVENDKKYDRLEADMKKAKVAKEAKDTSKDNKDTEKKKQLIAIMERLKEANTPPVLSEKEMKKEELMRIGQQIDESCDAQASNTNMPKALGTSLLPQGYDAKILGTTR